MNKKSLLLGLAVLFGIAGCGGGGSGTTGVTPIPTATFGGPPDDVNVLFTVNDNATNNLSVFGVTNVQTGALAAANSVTLTNNGDSFTPFAGVLAADGNAIFVSGNGGVMAVPLDSEVGLVNPSDVVLQAVPTESGHEPGLLTLDPSGTVLIAQTGSGLETYRIGSGDSLTAVASGQSTFGSTVDALSATSVGGAEVLVEGDTNGVFNTFLIHTGTGGLTESTDAAGVAVPSNEVILSLATSGAFGVAAEQSDRSHSPATNVQSFTLSLDGSSQPTLAVGAVAGSAGLGQATVGAPTVPGGGIAEEVTLANVGGSQVAYVGTNDVVSNVAVFPVASNAISALPSQNASTAQVATSEGDSGVTALSVLQPAAGGSNGAEPILYVTDFSNEVTPFQIATGGTLSAGAAQATPLNPSSVFGTSVLVTPL